MTLLPPYHCPACRSLAMRVAGRIVCDVCGLVSDRLPLPPVPVRAPVPQPFVGHGKMTPEEVAKREHQVLQVVERLTEHCSTTLVSNVTGLPIETARSILHRHADAGRIDRAVLTGTRRKRFRWGPIAGPRPGR